MSEPWRVLVLGTGAMATAFGAALARRGEAHVTLAGTWRDAIAALQARGAIVHDAAGEWRAPLAAVPLEDAGPADVVLVLAKSHQTAALAPVAARAAGARGVVVTLQNGLGHRAVLERAAGPGRRGGRRDDQRGDAARPRRGARVRRADDARRGAADARGRAPARRRARALGHRDAR